MSTIINATTTNGVVIQPDNSGSLALQTNNGTTALTIDTSQNVGIGTASPAEKLNVVGSSTNAVGMRVDNTQSSTVGTVYNTSTTYSYSGIGASTTWFYGNKTVAVGTDSANPVQFICNNAERMRIASDGNLLIGTASSGGRITAQSATANSSTKVIQLNNSAGTELLAIVSDGAFYTGSAASSPNNNTTATGANVVIASFGQLLRSTSALKYKQDIRDLEYIDINKFRPVRYKSKCKNDDKNKDHIGFIADEVEAIGLKELVSYGDNGEVEGFQYERMTPILVKAIQEQQTIINDLKARVETLEAK